MKKIIVFFVTTCCLFLHACSPGGDNMFSIYTTDHDETKACMDKLCEALQNRDKDALKALLSKNVVYAVEDTDAQVDALFDYFVGEYQSYYDPAATSTSAEKYDGKKRKYHEMTYEVYTNTNQYRVAILYYVYDTFDKDNEGIYSLYILNATDDSDLSVCYRGDGKYTPGINIGIPNIELIYEA
jgi:hypothetical protein